MALGTGMVVAGGIIVDGMYQSAKAAADFQSQLVLLQTHAGATQTQMEQLGGYILKVAGQLGFDPTSLAQAVYHVQSVMSSLPKDVQNVTSEEKLLYASAQLAAIGHANLEDSVNAVTKAFVVYQKDGLSAADITAIFNKTVGEGNMRLTDLNAAFATGLLPVAEQAGIKLQSVGAALATMTDEGIPATRASTYLRSAIIQMTIPSMAAATALNAIGVATNDAQSEISAFSQVLVKANVIQSDVSKELQKTGSLGDTMTWLRQKILATGMSSQDAGALLDKAFGGIRSGTGVVTLYNNLGGLVQKEKDATQATSDWSQTWSTFQSQDPNFQINKLKASWDSLVIVLGYAFLPVLLKVVETITPVVQRIGQWIAANSDLVAASVQGLAIFLLVGGAIVFVAGLIGRLIGFIIPVINWFIELGSTIEVAALTVDEFGASVTTSGAVLSAALGGPVTIAIAVIAALIAIGVLLVTHWQQVKQVAQMVWGWVAPYVAQAVGFIRGIIQTEMGWILSIWKEHHAQIMNIVNVAWTIIKVWFIGSLVVIAIAIGIVIIVIAALIAIIVGLVAGIMWLAGKFMDLVGVISHFIGQALPAIGKFFENLASGAVAAGGKFFSAIGHALSMAGNAIGGFFNAIGTLASRAWSVFAAHPAYWLGFIVGSIVGFVIKSAERINRFFDDVVAAAFAGWTRFVNWTITSLEAAWNAIVKWVGSTMSKVGSFFSWLIPTAAQKWMDFVNWSVVTVESLPGKIWNIVQDIAPKVWQAIKNAGQAAWSAWMDLQNGIIREATKLPGQVYNIGKDIVTGLVNGVISMHSWAWSQLTSFVSGLVDGMTKAIKGGSPSMLAAERVGVPLSQGIAVGMGMDMPNTQRIANSLTTGLVSGMGAGGRSGGGTPVNINQNQNQQIELKIDNEVLARVVIHNINNWREINEFP